MKQFVAMLLLTTSANATTLQPIVAPMTARDFIVEYSPGVAGITQTAGAIQYQIPGNGVGVCPAPDTTPPFYNKSPCHHVDYVEWERAENITNYSSITMTFKVNGVVPGTVFSFDTQPENCQDECSTSNIRFLLREGDYLGTDNRYWAHNVYFALDWVLSQPEAYPPGVVKNSDGSYTMTASLAPTEWSGVYGQMATTDPSGFAAIKRDTNLAGWTHGGGYFYGHGIFTAAGGPVTIQVTHFGYLP